MVLWSMTTSPGEADVSAPSAPSSVSRNELRGHEAGDDHRGAASRISRRVREHTAAGRVLAHAIGSDVVAAYGVARPAEIFGEGRAEQSHPDEPDHFPRGGRGHGRVQ